MEGFIPDLSIDVALGVHESIRRPAVSRSKTKCNMRSSMSHKDRGNSKFKSGSACHWP